jgi:S-phase kinase-associated protein 1
MADNRENPNPIPKVVDGKTIKLRTDDGEIFEVEEALAMELLTVKSFFNEDGVSYDTVVPLMNVSSSALAKVIQYCRGAVQFRAKLAEAIDEEGRQEVEKERKAFEAEFVNEEFGSGSVASNEWLKELTLAANYLNIKDMLSFLFLTIADRIKNKSVEYVRAFFGVENDYTPEEEQVIRDEHAWAFNNVDPDENVDAV